MKGLEKRDDERNWARGIAMVRHGIGGDPFGPSEAVVRERREGHIGNYLREWSP